MTTVAATASIQRPSFVSRTLDAHRHLRLATVIGAIALSVALAIAFGSWDRPPLKINTNVYVASAGLFIVALAIERLTELLIAPWVGRGDRRMDRNVLVGSFALLLGVVLSGLIGLRLLVLLSGGDPADDGWLATSVDLLATGLAIGAGTKPLHDLIATLEKRTQAAKEKEEVTTSPPPPPADRAVDDDAQPVPGVPAGGSYRLALSVTAPAGDRSARGRRTAQEQLSRVVAKLLPGWTQFSPPTPATVETAEMAKAKTATPASLLVHRSTAAVPGSPAFVNEQFSAAHRLHGAGLEVNLSPSLVRAGIGAPPAPEPRRALELIGLDATTQFECDGGRGICVAVLDTGHRAHQFGVDESRFVYLPDADVIDGHPRVADPLIKAPDWRDLDLVGAPGHGTGVAAVIAAGGNSTGKYTPAWWQQSPMIGVAPEATICPIRVMRGPVHLFDDDVAKGVRIATENKCDVISMSLGGLGFRGLAEEITKAVDAGIIVVCAAGNAFGVVVEPANYADTIAVASVGPDGQPYLDGSSRGPEVTVSAPGVRVIRPGFDLTQPEPDVLKPGTGTTFATAHVAGVAALWLAKRGADGSLAQYQRRQIPRLFAYLLGQTATAWTDPSLAADWGPGRVNARALLAEPLVDAGGKALISPDQLNAVFARKPAAVAVSDTFAGGIAAILTNDGTKKVREKIVGGLLTAWQWLRRKAPAAAARPTPERVRSASAAGTLLGAELHAHAGANPNFRRAVASATDRIPTPAAATPELRLVIEETNRTPGDDLPPNWGVGLSKPLRLALLGNGSMRRGFRSVGLLALAVTIAAIFVLDDGGAGGSTGEITTALGALGIGLYGGAQAIERLLEFTVGRWAFKNVPGREMDRALILLGCGILLGALASVALDTGLLTLVATPPLPDDAWFRQADVLITALAIGGGAKPLHDLLTRIRVAATPS